MASIDDWEQVVEKEFEVVLESEASVDEIAAVQMLLDDLDLDWDVEATAGQKSVDPQTVVSVLIVGPLAAYLAAWATEAAKDHRKKWKKFLHDLPKATNRKAIQIKIVDRDLWVIIPPYASTECLDAFLEIDWSAIDGKDDVLVWDEEAVIWKSATDQE